MIRVRAIAGCAPAILAILGFAAPAAAQSIGNNTPIQSMTVTRTSSSSPTAGGQTFFRADVTLADQNQSTRILGGGGSAFWNVAWSPSISVGNCGTTASIFASQTVSINQQGVFHENWSPNTPNTLLADGMMTMPTGTLVPAPASFTASLACGNNAATGMMAATWTGERYDGTYSFNNVNGIITVIGLTWTSSNPSVATIDNTGKATLLAEGDTTITATFGSLCWQTVPGTVACQGVTQGTYQLHVEPAPTGGGGGGGGGGAPLTAGPDQTVECTTSGGASATLEGQLFFTPQTPLSFTWTGPFGAASGISTSQFFPLGISTATLTISDGTRSASDSLAVTVVDTTPPQISGATASPALIWPPNGRMVPASIAVNVADACGAVTCQIISITGNDAAAAADWEVTGPLTLLVRAARSGAAGGRTYTATVECADGVGNKTTRTVDIVVPHGRGKN